MMSLILILHLTDSADITNLSFQTIKYKIKENQPAGLVVGNLLENLPIKRYFTASKLTFNLQKQSYDLFEIRKESSMLVTTKVIDLESLCSKSCFEGFKELLLIATVYKDLQFLEEIRIIILVEDVNDNDPIFKMSFYKKSVKEIIYGPGKSIELLRAYDNDVSSINRAISYALEKNSSYFQLKVSKEGQPSLLILRELDAEVESVHNLVLLAWNDIYSKKITTSLKVVIYIDDMNDNEPKFSQPIYKVPILENVELNHTIIQLRANDKDKTSKLQYLIMPGVNDEIKRTFIVSNNGLISLIMRLDYETSRQYSIPVGVTDGEFSSNARVEVIIIDVNDCSPQFSLNPANIIVAENSVIGQLLGQMTIYDKDSSYVDKGIICKEKNENQVMRFQNIDNINGRQLKVNILLHQKLDRDQVRGDLRSSIIICHDMGINERLTSSFTIYLSVTDKNDNEPVFQTKDYVVRIKENLRPQYVLTQVLAIDKDAGLNSQINYYIKNQDFNDVLKIDKESGEITALQSFDREKKDYYKVLVLATDLSVNETRLTSSTTVHIHVLDVNDCIPKINGSLTSFSISENKPIGTNIGTLEANDCDIGLNGKYVFILIPSAYSHYFELHSNGTILSKVIFDREKLSQVRFCLRITVRDFGEDNYLSSKTVVCISILDENDNSPQINIIPDFIAAQNYTTNHTFDFSALVSMFEPIGSPILSFSCTDNDEGLNSHIILDLQVISQDKSTSSLFQLNSTQKTVKLRRQWKKEDGEKFILSLTARDSGQIPLKTTKVIFIVFAKIPPRFYDNSISLATLSNTKINILIIVVLVTISSLLTAALVGAIICMIKPCGRKLFGCNRSSLRSSESVNQTSRSKSCPRTYLVANDMMGSLSNEGSELKTDVNLSLHDYCQSEHHWTHQNDDTGRMIKYYTSPPQVLPCTTTTTQEEQRSDSGRGASDEDNPTYFSNSDFFQNKPLYSVIPKICYSSFTDALNSCKSSSYIVSASQNPVSYISPTITLPSISSETVFSKYGISGDQHEDKCQFVNTSTLPFYSNPYRQNIKILQNPTTSYKDPEINIPLLTLEPYPFPILQSLPCSISDDKETSNFNGSEIVPLDDDITNLSSHIDQLFFTTRPIRLKYFNNN